MTLRRAYQIWTRRKLFLALALALAAWGHAAYNTFAGPPWSAQVSTSTPAAFFNVGTFTSPNGFMRLQAPNGQSTAMGQVLTITVTNSQAGTPAPPTAVLSNGIGYATITLSSNDWNTVMGGTGIHSNQWRITITHQ